MQKKKKNQNPSQLWLQLLFTDCLKEVGEEVFKYNEYNFALKLTNKQNKTKKQNGKGTKMPHPDVQPLHQK